MRQVLGGRHKVDIVGALLLEMQKNPGQLSGGDGLSKVFVADGVILTENATEGTAGKKDSAASTRGSA